MIPFPLIQKLLSDHKPEHVVDLDSGAIVSAKIHHADQGDTVIMHKY